MELIECACGCGEAFHRIDKWGRPRKFVSGHNTRRYSGLDATRWAVQKRWKKNNPGKVRDGKRTFYRKRKLQAMAELGNVCSFCSLGYNGKNAPVFEFHHPDPTVKGAGITRILTHLSWVKVQAELSKCILVCANCHNQHHGGEW